MVIYQAGVSPTMTQYAGGSGAINTQNTVGSWFINTWIFNGASSASQTNNIAESTGNAGTAGAGGVTMGAVANGTLPANFTITECLIYNTAHNSTQRTTIKNYLATKYGLSI